MLDELLSDPYKLVFIGFWFALGFELHSILHDIFDVLWQSIKERIMDGRHG